MSSLGDLELYKALEREARDDGCLRRQIGISLDMELELTLPQLKRIALHTREEHLLVGLKHLRKAGSSSGEAQSSGEA